MYSNNSAHLGATFSPGQDDFMMPEVISPIPQRSMPEMPGHIQDQLAHLELEVGPVSPMQRPMEMHGHSNFAGQSGSQYNRGAPQTGAPQGRYQQSLPQQNTHHGDYQQNTHPGDYQQSQGKLQEYYEDHPLFSPFPPMHNRSSNIPPTDQEREANLELARSTVLNSDDPEMQLTWAQDALAYVEIASQNDTRSSGAQGRPATPRVEHDLRISALDVINFLADQQHPRAQFLRGTWLEFGKFGNRRDLRESYRCYSRAAEKGYARAEYRMGMQFESSNEVSKALQHYRLGLQAHDAASSYRLGMMTILGQHGQTQDYYRGLELIKYSADYADENAPQGAYIYGMLLARELSQISVPERYLPMDVVGARTYVEKAAFFGFAKAQVKMGRAYELCELGCPFDPSLSLHYNNLAARQGDADAQMSISKWFLSGYEGAFSKNEQLAFEYAELAAQSGLATAEFAMGYFYEVGIHVPASISEARAWYSKAAEHGNKDAAGRISGISRSKTLSRKDHEQTTMAKLNSTRGRNPRAQRANPSNIISMPEPNTNYRTSSPIPYPDHPGPNQYPSQPNSAFNSPAIPSVSTFGGQPNLRPMASSIPAGQRISSASSHPPQSGPTVPNQSQPGYRIGPTTMPSQGIGRGRPFQDNGARPSPPGADIGFRAPFDPSGPDGRPNPSRLPPQNQRPGPDNSVYNPRMDRMSPRPPQGQAQSYGPGPGSQVESSVKIPSPGHAQRAESMPVRPGNTRPPGHVIPQPSKPPSVPSKSAASTPAPSSAQRPPPPKGPATFEEMGVPAQKTDGDCVLM